MKKYYDGSARLVVLAVLMLLAPTTALAASVKLKSNVYEIIATEDSEFGGCMVKTSVSLTGAGLDCKNGWISLDCGAVTGGTKSSSARIFELVMLAKVTGTKIQYLVTDDRQVNGYCVATRASALRY